MKYIVLDVEVVGLVREMPFIFPNELVHSDVYNSLRDMLEKKYKWNSRPIAAGFCDMVGGDICCHGKSETLGIESRGHEDQTLIRMCDYGIGIKA